jgi:predicted regulator of Ras-like GTPase activity (Roadblock/LC7/MglB family)
MQCNDFAASELTCSEWRRMFPADSGAELASLKISLRRFYKDRAASDGRAALAGLERLLARDPGHARALRLLAELCSRIGALHMAQEALTRLAQIVPDDPGVEMWRKKVNIALATSPEKMDLNRSLREVEETGQFPDPVPSSDDLEAQSRSHEKKVPRVLDSARPALGRLAKIPGVKLVVLVRGSAALVRGARHGGAEHVARATRAIAVSAKRSTRRMGLGSFNEVVIDTDAGSLLLHAGDPSCAAALVDKSTHMASVRRAIADLAAAPPDAADAASGAEGELVRA